MPEIRRLKENRSELGPGLLLDELLQRAQPRLVQIMERDAKGRSYLEALGQLPEVPPSVVELDREWVRIGRGQDLSAQEQARLRHSLEQLIPWRKGPFALFGNDLDCEWVSYLKWNRLKNHIAPLRGRRILDIGSSCGYYMFRMAAARPHMVLGIEPYATFYFQYLLLQHYIRASRVFCLPLKLEELPRLKGCFDTVFCMGILYHRRSPLDTLLQIHGHMKRGAELVLETLVINGKEDMALSPAGRYAKMNNVFFIPTVACLSHWLRRTGFADVRCIDVTPTTLKEQRRTPWIQSESLDAFLDRNDPTKTVEGYPAPIRAIVLATAA